MATDNNNPYLAPPLNPAPTQDRSEETISSTHEQRGGFWYPKTSPSVTQGEPEEATLGPEISPEEVSSLKFALTVWEVLGRVDRLLLADETPRDAYDTLKGERRAYRKMLGFLGFDATTRPSLSARRRPSVPSSPLR